MTRVCVHRQSGLTLLEVLISLSIFLLLLLGVYQLFDTSQATYSSGQMRADVQQNARLAMDEMARQMRMAGYFPENFASPPANPLLTNRIQVGTSVALAMYGDLDGTGASQVSLFCRNGSVLRRVTGAQGAAASYTCIGGDILAENVTGLTFTYFDANNTQLAAGAVSGLDGVAMGVPAFATTTDRQAVQTIEVTLTVQENVHIAGKQPQVFTLPSSVRLRNRN